MKKLQNHSYLYDFIRYARLLYQTMMFFVVDDADELNAEDIAKKLKPFRQLLDDAAVERELEAELQKDYLFASALHGHKMSLVKQDRGPSPPPAPIQHRKIRRSDLNIGKMIFDLIFSFTFCMYHLK